MTDADPPLRIGNADGVEAAIHPFGARLASVRVPGRDGVLETVLDHATPRPPPGDGNYLGNTVGRVSGRIAGARFLLDGRPYVLDANEGPNHLHGGPRGFHARRWSVLAHDRHGPRPRLLLELESADGDGGYPGALDVQAIFRIEGDALVAELTATSDVATPVALTMHPYFNLGGDHSREIAGHWLTLDAAHYLELDDAFLPTGRVEPVDGTAFDFRTSRRVGDVAPDDRALESTGGYDHTWICDPHAPRHARLEHRDSRLAMEVRSNQPSIQFYAGQYLEPTAGVAWGRRCGLCLEPQGWPNAVNEPGFPSPILQPGETYRNLIEYRFSEIR